jgi:integrase
MKKRKATGPRGPRTLHRLKATSVQTKKPGLYADGGGLYLQVTSPTAKSWLFRYAVNGTERYHGLGSVNAISLERAREEARRCRELRYDGIDPIEYRKTERQKRALEAAKTITFDECVAGYLDAHEDGWQNAKHRQQWRNTLATYASPVFGSLPVQSVDTDLIVKALQPIWKRVPETASRVRGRIEAVLDWATVGGFRSGDNPARWSGHLEYVLARRQQNGDDHHPALDYKDMPRFMADLGGRDGISARALEFLVLSAARTGAVIGATWNEIDLDERVWTVPASRVGAKIKDGKPRQVPLCDRAVEILRGLPREKGNRHVFVGGRSGKGLSNMAMAELMRGMAYPSTTPGRLAVPHGMRSSFKDWCAERTNFENIVSEAALWHTVSDKVERAYRRGQLFEKRRRLMAEWAKYCTSPAPAGKVVSLRGAR